MNENECIKLDEIGISAFAQPILIYHIKREELLIIKQWKEYDNENIKLMKREEKNYLNLAFPFFPKFICSSNENTNIVTEFINGQTLLNIEELHLDINDKLTIIFELMLIIGFFYCNHYIYRDLKPNNVIIDHNKTAVLIDFDRMVNSDDKINDEEYTADFSTNFVAPEVNLGSYSHKSNIFSLGKMMNYILNYKKSENLNEFEQFPLIKEMYYKCINENVNKRPSIIELMIEFYINYHSQIKIENLSGIFDIFRNKIADKTVLPYIKHVILCPNDPESLSRIAILYLNGKCFNYDINKAIHYFTLAANLNDLSAQIYLGNIYFKGESVSRDIKKAIHYFTLAAEQNDPTAQYVLSLLYSNGQYVSKDVNKTIKYLSFAAKQNDSNAQFMLGNIYLEGRIVQRDINKAIYYFTMAANQNDPRAQLNLGSIYYNADGVPCDIEKAIYYFSLAAKHNLIEAQYNLGIVYLYGRYVKYDINKAIYYFTLAAKQNDTKSQLNLGAIYYRGQGVPRDINKAIYYLSRAANYNLPEAQYNLGAIYLSSFSKATYDVKKAIYYFELAANQNFDKAQFILGNIYLNGNLVQQNITKAICYYLSASKHNNPIACLILGLFYFVGLHVSQDINKAINFLTISSNYNNPIAQHILGLIYCDGLKTRVNKNKAFNLLNQSCKNGYKIACFSLGYLYHEGKCVNKDIKKSISLYKEASSFNIQYAKNNLGIIYKKGIENEVDKNVSFAIELFNEAIRQKNDILAMYNLSNIYFYDETIKIDNDKLINLLIRSSNKGFIYSKELLCLVLLKLCNFNIENIKKELCQHFGLSDDFSIMICKMIHNYKLYDASVFDEKKT